MTRNIAKGLLERGIEVYAVVPIREGQNRFEELDGIKVYGVNTFNPLDFIKTYKQIDADIYHSEEPYIGTYFAKLAQPHKQHIVSFIDPSDLNDWMIEISHYPFKKKLLSPAYYAFEKNFLIDKSVRSANVLCIQTKFIEEKARRIYGVHGNKEVVFLPHPCVEPKGPFSKSEKPTMLFLGRLDRRKRPELYLDLASKFPDMRFIVVGRAHDKNYDDYLLQKYMDVKNIDFRGFIDQYTSDEFDRILRETWILINTADREGLPATFLEAVSYDSAILSSNNPDNFAENFGYFVQNDDFEYGLKWLLENDRWRSLAKKGREYFLEHYEWNKVIDLHIKIYKKALSAI